MTIAFVAGSTGPNSSGASETLTLPTGYNTAGNITLAAFIFSYATGTVVVPPSGWTVLYSSMNCLVCYRLYQSGDASTITATATGTPTGSPFWMSAAVTYSGVDATNPVDGVNSLTSYPVGSGQVFSHTTRGPSLNPNYATDQLVTFSMLAYSGNGGSFTPPSGQTTRASAASGPSCAISDVALSSAAATGDQTSTWAAAGASGLPQVGVNVLLKTSGATPQTPASPNPSIVGLSAIESGTAAATWTPNLAWLNLQAGDLLVVGLTNSVSGTTGTTMTPPSGWTQIQSLNFGAVFTHTWTGSGDNTSPVFTLGASAFAEGVVSVLRKTGTGTQVPAVDLSGSAGGTSTSASAPSLTCANPPEALLLHFMAQSTSSGGWSTTPTGPTTDAQITFGPSVLFAFEAAASNPSGTFSASQSSANVAAFSALVKLAAAPVVPKQPQQMCLT
jgi:hypothetical protein